MVAPKFYSGFLKQELKTRTSLRQKLVFLSLQLNEYSLLRITLATILLTSLGIAGRVALQYVPSVEPLTSLSILSGFLFGPLPGFVSGWSGFYVSNFFVWGSQGPWTPFQSLGAGLAGLLGGLIGKLKNDRKFFLFATIIGIGVYEITVSLGLGFVMSLNIAFAIFYLITSLPFTAIHLISSLGFSISFFEFKDFLLKIKGGKILEKEILGFRIDDSASSNSGGKPIPFFHIRKSSRPSKNKSGHRFWFKRRNKES